MAGTIPFPDEVAELFQFRLVVAHEDGRDADGQIRYGAREDEERLETLERPVVEAGHGAHPVVELAKAVDRDGDADAERRRRRAHPLDHRADFRGREAVRRNADVEDAAALGIRPDDLRQVAAQERLPARDEQQPDRRQRVGESLDLFQRELVLSGVDRVEAVRAARIAYRGHEVRPLGKGRARRDPVAGEREALSEAGERHALFSVNEPTSPLRSRDSFRASKNPRMRCTSPATSHGKSARALPA